MHLWSSIRELLPDALRRFPERSFRQGHSSLVIPRTIDDAAICPPRLRPR